MPPEGQAWTTPDVLRAEAHDYEFRELEPGLHGFRSSPVFAIGPRALIVQTLAGNLLWDVPSRIDAATVKRIEALGGIAAIASSHPHFYGSMVDWSDAFGGVPIHLPATDREWVMRSSPAIRFWEETHEVLPGLVAVRCGGHFEGSSVLHWAAGAEGRGVLLSGDTIMVVPDTGWVSFMRSYPNLIPLSARTVQRIAEAVAPLAFVRIYGNPGWERYLAEGAADAVRRSALRYREAVGGGE